MKHRHAAFRIRTWVIAIGILLPMAAAYALINPNFTPVHLLRQSDTVVSLAFDGVDDDGMVKARVVSVLKGEPSYDSIRIDPSASIAVAQQEAFVDATSIEGQQALLFVGSFRPGGFDGGVLDLGQDAGGDGPKAIGFLHIDGLPAAQWLILENWEDDLWDMVQSEAFLLATYNGGTAMLERMVRYILSDPEADVPVNAGVRWLDPPQQIGKIEGTAQRAVSIQLDPDATALGADLFVASNAGDRLFRPIDGILTDRTEQAGLSSRSTVFAWGDFTGDGRLDLASFDGSALSLHLQQEDGSFRPRPLALDDALEHGCLSLTTIEVGSTTAGLIIGTKQVPVLVLFQDGQASWRPLVDDATAVTPPSDPSICLVADFDGDGLSDVMQLGAANSLLFPGVGPGRFAQPVATTAATGSGRHGVSLGDFDQNGLPDIFIASERRHLLWQNAGDLRFDETLMLSGELSYKLTSEGVEAHVADLNNDGREDLLITYSGRQAPYILYNRGFRSFAHAIQLDLDRENRLPQMADGQQTVCFGDFAGNGGIELVTVLNDGTIWHLSRETEGPNALAIQAVLPPGESGPVSVTAMRFERVLGMRQATPGRPAIIGTRRPGPILLSWQYPNGAQQQQEVILEDRPLRVVLKR